MVDSLKAIWNRQAKQQHEIFRFDGVEIDPVTRERMVTDYLLGLMKVSADLNRMLYTGSHVLSRQTPTKSNVGLACVDVFKYIVSIALLHGVTPEEFIDLFFAKSDVVDDKLRMSRAKIAEAERVALVDLDGVVFDWHGGFRRWCSENFYVDLKNTYEAEKARNEFYASGGFLTLDAISGAVEGIAAIREAGIKVAIVTARPRWQHERIHADTMEALKRAGVGYDAIFFGKDKADIIYENILPATVEFFVEDRPKHVIELIAAGVRVLMLRGEENISFTEQHDRLIRVADWREIEKFITQLR